MKIEIVLLDDSVQAVMVDLDGRRHCTSDIRLLDDNVVLCLSDETECSSEVGSSSLAIQKCIELEIYHSKFVEVDDELCSVYAEGYLTCISVPISVFSEFYIY